MSRPARGQPHARPLCAIPSLPHAVAWTLLFAAFLAGCTFRIGDDEPQVVLYTSVDQQIARPLVAAFQEQTGVRVLPRYDTELTKTTGLVQRLRSEAERPACDVFWSSEVFHTIRLADEGLFEPVTDLISERDGEAAAALGEVLAAWPDRYRDPEGRWYAFGLRARVIAFNTRQVEKEDVPRDVFALAGAAWKDKVVMAQPSFGTTGGHVASWFALLGAQRAKQFLEELEANGVRLVGGNSQAVEEVAYGRAQLCLTDTDDVWAAQRNEWPVDLVYARHGDQGPLLIPNTAARVRGGPNPEQASRLLAFLLSKETEEHLARSDSHNIPVRDKLAERFVQYRVADPMTLSYAEIAEQMVPALAAAGRVFGL